MSRVNKYRLEFLCRFESVDQVQEGKKPSEDVVKELSAGGELKGEAVFCARLSKLSYYNLDLGRRGELMR